MISPLLLIAILATLQESDAKKLLNELAPPPGLMMQLEWDSGASKGSAYFKRNQVWRADQQLGKLGQVVVWNGKDLLTYQASSNRYFRTPKNSMAALQAVAGPLAEIFYTGTADRIVQEASKSTVAKEKLDDVDCSHVTLFRKDKDRDIEEHYWIDAEKKCRRVVIKSTSAGKTSERKFDYKTIDPASAGEDVFKFQPPADAKDMKG